MTIPKLYNLPTVNQSALMTIAEGDFIPFDIQRVYWITSNIQDQIRGEHAHKSCQQLLSCLSGKLKITMEDIQGKKYHFELSQPNEMVLIPSQYWCKIEYNKDAIVLVMASQGYDAKDYIREYNTFKSQTTS
ncbi:FdtA/QdtA family cupin domain-containing protein [Reichenbachiella carrageenanivorans]|uniref:FdtA/QdtA family cupin domain-containing protein n=1 Tax=Reichenbachiella carrageenanivorans TaxID=2979869 RepID=A0ABY6D1I1_9BACT|nr:FdtA/QdtA family cupin domain-containing protein [Reichenbachiella carrageenanivorans]UXX80027.1 FdtA/QdtA family cupin domain-containing protein [Reichenbachiella carrageenanivorans]